MAVVLAQPHRQGRSIRYAGSSEGQAMLAGRLTPAEFGALERYVRLTHEVHRVIPSIPRVPSIMSEGGGGGADIDPEEVQRIRDAHAAAMEALAGYGTISHEEVLRTLMRVCVLGSWITAEREVEVLAFAAGRLARLWAVS